MARTVQARLDAGSERDLSLLRAEADRNESEVIRLALAEAAARRRRKSSLRQEAAAAAADPADRAAARAVRAEMDALASPLDD